MKKGMNRIISIGVSALLAVSTFLTVIPQTETIVYADDVAEVSTEAELNAAIANSTHQNPKKVRITTPITLTANLSLNDKGLEIVGGELNTGERLISVDSGYLKLSAGSISGSSECGNIIVLTGSGTGKFIMSGGTITSSARGIQCLYITNGGFEMSGGTIICNGNAQFGVRVTNSGTFEMSGGSVTNSGTGGVCVDASYRGTFRMTGGTISNNDTSNGAAVDVYESGTLDYESGTITGNVKLNGGVQCVVTMTNDGHGTASASPTYGAKNTEVTVTATPNSNYHFSAWQVISGGVTLSSTTTNPATFRIGTANVQVKAHFERTYNLIYDKNGGSGSMDPIEVNNGDKYIFPQCSFTPPPKKRFDHWEIIGVDIWGYPNDEVTIDPGFVTGGKITVTANWKDMAVVTGKPEGKTLKYNGSEQELVSAGEAENGTMNYAIGDDDTTAPDTGWSETVPKRKDKGTYYVWYKAKGTGGYADSDPGFTTATISDKDPVKVDKVELSDDKLTLSPGESGQLTATIVPKDATDQEVSWAVDDESIAKITSDDKECTVTAVAAGETEVTVKTKDGGKEAVCKIIVEDKPGNCTITFKANGGKGEMKPQSGDKGDTVKLHANDFTRSGYEFKNWNTKADGSGDKYDNKESIKLEKDLTLYAQWKEKEDDDDDDHEEEPAPKKDVKYPDGFDELRGLLNKAISDAKSSGLEQKVTWDKGTSLPYDVMKMLQDNPKVTLEFSYTYQDQKYTVTIPGSRVITNPSIQWYGPVYLYALYGQNQKDTLPAQTSAATGTYTVKSGDTLSGIAKRLNTTLKHLKDANNIKDADKIKPGMVLKY